jgi:hypothetical protein
MNSWQQSERDCKENLVLRKWFMGTADPGRHSFKGLITGGNIIWFMFLELLRVDNYKILNKTSGAAGILYGYGDII